MLITRAPLAMLMTLKVPAGSLPLVIVSANVPAGVVMLVDQAEVLLGDMEDVNISVSEEGSLHLDSAPGAGAQPLTSLWQRNLVGIRCERTVNWMPAHSPAKTGAFVTGASYAS